MASADYFKAYKAGKNEYHNAVSKGEYPYLPVLDDVLSYVPTESQVNLGLVEIPIEFVVGTYSAGRTTAFARNFMPILDPDSEFANKWALLYDDLVKDGLRDPIKAYEFNNRFYIMEGNKRVSIMKSMDAVSIEAYVTRVIPKRNDEDHDTRLYYEFLEFYDLTRINCLNVKKEGSYKKLIVHTGHDQETKWSDEDRQNFETLYFYFSQEFKVKAQNKMEDIGAGDALAAYLEIFDYCEAKDKSQQQLKRDITKMWNEFQMLNSEREVQLVLSPTEESKKQSLINLFPIAIGASALKVAFIHEKSVENSAWIYSHELGRKYIQDVFGDKIETTCRESVNDESADEVFEEAIRMGNKVIFATSPTLCSPAVKAAVNHPDVKILNCSMLLNHKNVRGYYLRMYEAKFISGAIAGSLTKNGYVGYLSDYPIRGTTAEINAFALGVQMTNPDAKVVLEWTMLKDRDWHKEFENKGVDLISGRDLNAGKDKIREYGLFRVLPDGSHSNLCMPVRHWGKMYEEIIGSVLRGAYKNDDSTVGTQALNYFWGMSSDAVDVIYSRNLPSGSVRMLRNLRDGIKNNDINPFTGPIYSQDGMLRCEDGRNISPEEAVVIDWLLENVEGYIPGVNELSDEAEALVNTQGVL